MESEKDNAVIVFINNSFNAVYAFIALQTEIISIMQTYYNNHQKYWRYQAVKNPFSQDISYVFIPEKKIAHLRMRSEKSEEVIFFSSS